jgi:hypothetical protein
MTYGQSSTAGVRVRMPESLWRGMTTYEQSSTADVRARMLGSLWRGRGSAGKTSRVAPRSGLRSSFSTNSEGCPNPDGRPIGRRWLHRTCGSSPRGDLATQVPTTPAEEVRRDIKPIRIHAGLRHRYYGSRWKHCRDGELLPCSLDRTDPDLAHES